MADQKIRVLCLHGMGTNNKVFEAQTAALRHELGDEYEWNFVEGCYPVPMSSALKGFYPEDDKYYSYFDINDPTSLDPILRLEEYIFFEGPFDIVMGACSTASLAAAYQLRREGEGVVDQLFKGAVFLSAGHPFDHNALENGLQYLENPTGNSQLRIPTANIWGANDKQAGETAPRLAALCSPKSNTNFIHNAQSSIPQAKDVDDLIGAAQAIQRTVDMALFAY